MLQKVLTSTTITIQRTGDTLLVQTTTKSIESTLGGGKPVREVVRYDRLTEGETRDLLEVLAHADLPGTVTMPQPSLF